MNRSEHLLNESGITVAPPPRSRLSTPNSLPAPPTQLPAQTCQRRPDLPASVPDNKKKEKRASHSTESDSNKSTKTSDTSSTDNKEGLDDHEGKKKLSDVLFYC